MLAWGAAVDAALSALPALLQLAADVRLPQPSAVATELQSAIVSMTLNCLLFSERAALFAADYVSRPLAAGSGSSTGVGVSPSSGTGDASSEAASAAEQQQLAAQLFQLHSRACRVAHGVLS
jgi:hypothetical protein